MRFCLPALLLALSACAAVRPPASSCAASCERAYGKPMPDARLVDGGCSCLPNIVHLNVVMQPAGWISTGSNAAPAQEK